MTFASTPRDYSLTGENSTSGFELNDWYKTPISRKELKTLMKRSDRQALINYTIWVGCTLALGGLVIATWDTWWAIPSTFAYGIFYGSGADSRWHETGHGTVFKSRWLNDLFYQLTSFMSMRNPYVWRWSHARHHTETVVVGRDPEIAFPRPPSIWAWVLNLLYIPAILNELRKMMRISAGKLTKSEQSFVPEMDHGKAYLASRIQLAILLSISALSLLLESWLPIVLVGLPTFYGSWLHHMLATTQHAGLAEDIPDHRMNSRTIYVNPFFRFIYSNMNYHVEHHMFPNVPFYALPALHNAIKTDCPPALPSLWAAYKEMVPAVLKQQRDQNHYIQRRLPLGANPTPNYRRPQIGAK